MHSRKNNPVLTDKSYENLSEIMLIVLNECSGVNDSKTAKNLIHFSQIFYKENEGKQEYIQDLLKSHSV